MSEFKGTLDEKVNAVINSDEVILVVKMFILLMDDTNLQNHVTTEYELGDYRYKLDFTKQLIKKATE